VAEEWQQFELQMTPWMTLLETIIGVISITHDTNDTNTLVSPILDAPCPLRNPRPTFLNFPLCTMNDPAFELLQAVNVGPRPPAQTAQAPKQYIRGVFEFLEVRLPVPVRPSDVGLALGAPDREVPFAGGFVVLRARNAVMHLDVWAQLVLIDDAVEVGPDLWARCVIGGPISLVGGESSLMVVEQDCTDVFRKCKLVLHLEQEC